EIELRWRAAAERWRIAAGCDRDRAAGWNRPHLDRHTRALEATRLPFGRAFFDRRVLALGDVASKRERALLEREHLLVSRRDGEPRVWIRLERVGREVEAQRVLVATRLVRAVALIDATARLGGLARPGMRAAERRDDQAEHRDSRHRFLGARGESGSVTG